MAHWYLLTHFLTNSLIHPLTSSNSPSNISSVTFWHTALHIACQQGSLPLVLLLLQHGADIHLKADSANGERPLHSCCMHGQLGCARLLLEAGVQTDLRCVSWSTNISSYLLSTYSLVHALSNTPTHTLYYITTLREVMDIILETHPQTHTLFNSHPTHHHHQQQQQHQHH